MSSYDHLEKSLGVFSNVALFVLSATNYTFFDIAWILAFKYLLK